MDIKAAALESLPSSSRVMRNLAEKQRRDKLNSFIGELATLVPVVASSSRKLDKTSILRLSANFLRLHQNVDLRKNGHAQQPGSQTAAQVGHMILDALEGFLLVICSTGKVMYVSESVEKLLGHSQVDMMGLPFCYFVHPDDQVTVRRHLGGFLSQASASRCGPESEGQRCIFECRLAGRPLARGEPINYERVQITGYFRTPGVRTVEESQDAKPKSKTKNGSTVDTSQGNVRPSESTFVAVVRMVQQAPISTSLTIIDSMRDQYITRHLPDGRIIHTDHRISIIAGYFTEEVQGESAFNFIYTEDLHWALLGYKLMASSPNGEGFTVYRLVSRTGTLIYLRSKGFVEIDSTTQQMVGFVCVNSLLSEEEGELEIHRIREHLTNITAEHPALGSLNAQSVTYPTWSDNSSSSLPAPPAASSSAVSSGSSPCKRVCLSSLAHNSSPASSTPSPVAPSLPVSPPAAVAVSPASAAAAAAAVTAAQLRRLRTVKESVYVNRASMSGGQASTTTVGAEEAASVSSLQAVDCCTSPMSFNGGFLGSASTSSLSPKSEDSCSPSGPDLKHQERFHAVPRVISPRCSASPPYPARHGCGPIRYRKSRSSKDLIVGNSPTASTGNA